MAERPRQRRPLLSRGLDPRALTPPPLPDLCAYKAGGRLLFAGGVD
jgi:hypothetical protein